MVVLELAINFWRVVERFMVAVFCVVDIANIRQCFAYPNIHAKINCIYVMSALSSVNHESGFFSATAISCLSTYPRFLPLVLR